jgi:hypothetical protein
MSNAEEERPLKHANAYQLFLWHWDNRINISCHVAIHWNAHHLRIRLDQRHSRLVAS